MICSNALVARLNRLLDRRIVTTHLWPLFETPRVCRKHVRIFRTTRAQTHAHVSRRIRGLSIVHIRGGYIISQAVLKSGESGLGSWSVLRTAGLQELIALLGRIVHHAWKMGRRTSGEITDVCLVQTRVKMHCRFMQVVSSWKLVAIGRIR